MAEGLLEGALGGEEEKPEVEAPETLAGVEAFAAAIAAKLSGNDPGVALDTSVFLKKQAQLLEIQAAHLKDEHEARLHFLRGQAREVDIRRVREVGSACPTEPDGKPASLRLLPFL